jgi:hypothetical protein
MKQLKCSLVRPVGLSVLAGMALAAAAFGQGVGYEDTPFLPDGKWRVHDKARPNPKVITPGTFSTQDQPGQPPSDAVVLFDGSGLLQWVGTKKDPNVAGDPEPRWKVENGCLEVTKTGDIRTKESFGSCQLHIEWMVPEGMPGTSQGCGNSGVFLMDRYEIQVLNSYENVTYADGQAAALYGHQPPLVNASRKPGQWQVYDIVFEAPVFKDGKVEKPAVVTVFHNGVLVQNRVELLGASTHRKVPSYQPHAEKMPLRLQDHGNPIRYRNIWIRPL